MCAKNYQIRTLIKHLWKSIDFPRNCPKFDIFTKIVILKA